MEAKDLGKAIRKELQNYAKVEKKILNEAVKQATKEAVKEAAEKTNTLAGDGTTTATLLTYALAKEGLRNIKT